MIERASRTETDQPASAGAVLGRMLDQVLETVPELHAMSDRLESVERLVKVQTVEVERVRADAEWQTDALKTLCSRQELLEHASRQQAQLTDQHYRDHVVSPVARQLIALVDTTDDASRGCEGTEGAGAAASLIKGIRGSLLDTLARLGVELASCAAGAPFDPKRMRPGGFRSTDDPDQDHTVAEVLKPGFLMRESTLRPASVALFRLQTHNPSVHIKEGAVR